MAFETVKTESKNGVLWMTLNRPEKLNAFNEQMGDDLLEALKEGERSATDRCLVLTGEGRAFSVGEDLGGTRAAYEEGKPILLGEDPADQPQAQSPVRVDGLAEEPHLHGLPEPEYARQPEARPGVGGEPPLDEGLVEGCLL